MAFLGIEDTGCTAALFLSVWPETFSYTLSEAWRVGLHPIALDIGAPAERIREMNLGTIIPFSQNSKEIVQVLLATLAVQEGGSDAVFQSQVTASEDFE